MVEYSKVNVKLTDRQLKQLKIAVKDKTGTTLRMNLKYSASWTLTDNKTKNEAKKCN